MPVDLLQNSSVAAEMAPGQENGVSAARVLLGTGTRATRDSMIPGSGPKCDTVFSKVW